MNNIWNGKNSQDYQMRVLKLPSYESCYFVGS
jgi:hypothetical protein